MAKIYTKGVWVDEALDGEERYDILEDDDTPISETVQIVLTTTIDTPGTALTAAMMNNIEEGVDALDTLLSDTITSLDDYGNLSSSGAVTPGHLAVWIDSDTLEDGGAIAEGGLGVILDVTATTPLVSSGGASPDISMTNQGTTTTVLHGNAAGNPAFSKVALADLATQAADTVLANATSGAAVPTAVVVGEQTLVGRITDGRVAALTVAQVRTLLGLDVVDDSIGGTYTPTLTTSTNVTTLYNFESCYTRIADIVTVQGYFEAIASSADVACAAFISLPVASYFSNVYELAGSGCVTYNGEHTPIYITADTSNHTRAVISFTSLETSPAKMTGTFQFTYQVLAD